MNCPACNASNADGAESCIACGNALVGAARPAGPGSLFANRYEILDVLGRGGMGMVYKVKDRNLDEVIALKVIRPDLVQDKDLRDRFRSEIKLARRIRHKNVCSIFGDGDDAGVLYLSMELVEGSDLRKLVREQGGLPWPQAFEVSIQIAEGLQAIHDVGIIHRDLKTVNIMRDARGVIRLLDFGLAKQSLAEESVGATATGHVVGTPAYMSPEQGRSEKLTFASDVYSLGVVIFEIFTGDVPFHGDTPLRTMLMHLQDPPPLEGARAIRLPNALVPILRKALAKAPSERFASVAELATALRAARDLSGDEGATPLRVAAVEGEDGSRTAAAPTVVAGTPSGPWMSSPRRLGAAGLAIALGATAWWLVSRSGATGVRDVPQATNDSAAMGPESTGTPPRGDFASTDSAGDRVVEDPVGCLVVGEFSEIRAQFRGEQPSTLAARLYFRSNLSPEWFYTPMAASRGSLLGFIPKINRGGDIRKITYYVDINTGQGHVRTPDRQAIVADAPATCPPGSRIAPRGDPKGVVSVTSATVPAIELKNALGVDALVGLLKDRDASVREEAATALRGLVPAVKAKVEQALARLANKDPDEREGAASDLEDISRFIVSEAVMPLIAMTKDPNTNARIRAVESLGEIAPLVARTATALRGALRDASPDVRKMAVQALGSVGSVTGATMAALDDVPGAVDGSDLLNAVTVARRNIEAAGK